jgi:hypothetical protein
MCITNKIKWKKNGKKWKNRKSNPLLKGRFILIDNGLQQKL